jgi:hypothetical protein
VQIDFGSGFRGDVSKIDRHTRPYDDDVITEGDEGAAVELHQKGLAASRKRKPKFKSKKGRASEGPSSGTGGSEKAKRPKKDNKIPSLPAFKLPQVNWKPVKEFKLIGRVRQVPATRETDFSPACTHPSIRASHS